MTCTVTRAHFGRILIEAEGHRSGVFEPGRRTLTGAKHRNGEFRCMSANSVLDYLGIERASLRNVYDSVTVDDKGIFDPLTPVDISMHAKSVFNVVSVPVQTLMGACALEGRKADG